MSAQNPGLAPAQSDSGLSRWKPSARQVIQGLLGLGLAVGLLVWGLPFFVGTTWAEVFAELRQIGPGTALKLLALMLSGLWLYTFMLTGSLPGLSHPKAMILNVSSSAVGNLLPGGGAAGVAATYGMCRSWGFARRDISTSVIVSGVWNVLGRLALPVIGTAVLLTDAANLPKAVVQGGAIGAVLGVGLLVVFITVIVSGRAATSVGRGLDKALNPLWRRSRTSEALSIDELVHDLRGRLNAVVRSGWPSMSFGLFGFFSVYYVLFWFALDAAHVHVSFAHLFAAYAVGRLLSTVGFTPGGIGVTEPLTAAVLIGFGANPAAATAGVVLFSIYVHLLEIPLGAIGWVVWGVSRKTSPTPDPLLASPALDSATD
ncbi:MAG: lysylphosphatidylglycerol synthase transmembrane domain-containing protein [Actinomycetota bacterium]